MKKYIRDFVLLNIFCWLLFIGCDFIEENVSSLRNMTDIGIFFIPVLSFVLMIIARLKKYGKNMKVSQLFTCVGIWLLLTAIIGYVIGYMVNYNKWIIKQHTYEILDFNGLEYVVFAVFLAVAGTIPVIMLYFATQSFMDYTKTK